MLKAQLCSIQLARLARVTYTRRNGAQDALRLGAAGGCELQLCQAAVKPSLGNQRVVVALFGDFPSFDHHDSIGFANG